MVVVIMFVLLLSLCSILIVDSENNFIAHAKAAHNESRKAVVINTLKQVAGVYTDKNKGSKLGLEKTIFMSVASFSTQNGVGHYKVYLRNLLCFTQHYGIDTLLYVLHHGIDNVETESRDLESLGAKVLTYPDELFWTILSHKKTPMKTGRGYADYVGNTPSFANFGALVMLVPVLEVLELGYNVIFFDVDIGLVQDPVPYLTASKADFVASLESRYCPQYNAIEDNLLTNWKSAEPNTGIMHVRSTVNGKKYFRAWLDRIVAANVLNDQRAMDREALNAVYVTDCLDVNDANYKQHNNNNNKHSEHPTVCFLNDLMFQNGMIAVQCPIKPAHRDDWFLAMHKHGTPGHSTLSNDSSARFPVTVHANYCKGKSHELNLRGLWLLHEDHEHITSCRPYNMSGTYYASAVNWNQEIEAIKQHRVTIFESIHNGSVVQGAGSQEVFYVDGIVRRRIPDKDTFETMFGENWGIVKSIPSEVLYNITEGPPLKSLATP